MQIELKPATSPALFPSRRPLPVLLFQPRALHLLTGAPAELHRSAGRLLASGSGVDATGVKLAGVSVITDGLLVVSLEAVQAAAADAVEPKPNGRAQMRLLACLVAGAVGAATILTEDEQLAAGKRLDKQARAVSRQLDEACQSASELRAVRRDEAAEDTELATFCSDDINAEEAAALMALISEVYVGFYELGALGESARVLPPPVLLL